MSSLSAEYIYINFFLPKWMDHEQRENQITGLGLPSFLLLGIGSVLNLCRILQIRYSTSREKALKKEEEEDGLRGGRNFYLRICEFNLLRSKWTKDLDLPFRAVEQWSSGADGNENLFHHLIWRKGVTITRRKF